MGLIQNFKDAMAMRKAGHVAQEIADRLFISPLCSNYENLFAQVRPMVNEMKVVRPFGVSKMGKQLPMSKTPELAILDYPNDQMGWADFMDLAISTWLTESELDIHVWTNKSGTRVEGYTILPPTSRVYLGYGRWEWQVMTDNGMEVLTEDSVMRLRFSRSPQNPHLGVSPATANRVWAQIDDLLGQYQKAFFENGAVPATITFIAASTEEKYKKAKKELERGLKGAENRNKTVYAWRQVLDDGSSADQLEVKTIQGNNSTLAIKELASIVDDRLNKSIGVSNFILGDDSSAKYDNAELSDFQFTRRRVYPALVSFWGQFQHELDRITGGLGYGIDFKLDIPELTERKKVIAETAKYNRENLITLIEAGSSPLAAVDALGLGDNWKATATSIYASMVAGSSVKGSADKLIQQVQDTKTEYLPKTLCTGNKDVKERTATIDTAPISDDVEEEVEEPDWGDDEEAEEKIYNELVELAESDAANTVEDMTGKRPAEAPQKTADGVVSAIVDIVSGVALNGVVEASDSLKTQVEGEVKVAIEKLGKDPKISKDLMAKFKARADDLVKRYGDYTKTNFENALLNKKPQSASDIARTLKQVIPKGRAEMIARNETTYAERSGRLDADKSIADEYGLKITLVWRCHHDGKTCPVCEAMDGEETELGTAFPDSVEKDGVKHAWEHTDWNDSGEIPDAHVNCVLGDTTVLADGVQVATKMSYSGEVINITTAKGRNLTVTPNHILLTARGWVAAKNLTKSDKIIAHSDCVESLALDDTIDGNVSTVAEQFVAASKHAGVVSAKMPITAKDFKGDGVAEQEIDIILPNGLLRNNSELSSGELLEYLPFVNGAVANSSFPGLSTLDQLLIGVLATADGIVGSRGEELTLAGSKSGHAGIHGLTSSARYDARLLEAKTNSGTRTPELFGESFLANAGLIELDDVVGVEVNSVHDTPVYDLQTTSTLYSANGLVSSNCRCYYDEKVEVL